MTSTSKNGHNPGATTTRRAKIEQILRSEVPQRAAAPTEGTQLFDEVYAALKEAPPKCALKVEFGSEYEAKRRRDSLNKMFLRYVGRKAVRMVMRGNVLYIERGKGWPE